MVDRYAQLRSPISEWDLAEKRVFLRADLNVPLEHGHILDSFRLEAVLPTLKLLLDKGAHVTVGTHLSQKNDEVPGTAPLKTWFANHGYSERVTLLENLRLSPGERTQSITYAQELAQHIDFYVNDAFGSCHRSDTSLVTLPTLFDVNHRGIGLLVEKELTMLSKLKDNPNKPMLMILGGDKAQDKQRYFEGLCAIATDFLLCPCWAELAPKLTLLAHKKGVTLHVPQDYLVGQGWDGPYAYKAPEEIQPSDLVIAIGPKTVQAWTSLIMQAKTIFVNGPMGDLSRPATVQELKTVLRTVTQAHAYRVVGGGSTVAALKFFNLINQVDYCSTGGGATLAYIANQPLPALDALLVPSHG